MFTLLVTLLSKIVDVVLNRASIKKDEVGPLRMYELYICLREMILNAKEILKELGDSIQSKDHVPHIAFAIDRQSKQLKRFTELLWGMIFYLHIFDREVHDELSQIIGIKFQALSMYYHLFEKVDESHLVINEWKGLGKQMQLLLHRYAYLDTSGLEKDALIKANTYDLHSTNDLEVLKAQAMQNISQMELVLERFGTFIKENCDFVDLFPKKVPFG
jgi:hypothetical protein